MNNSLYAQFEVPIQAERALEILFDLGGKAMDLTALFPLQYQGLGRFSALALLAIPGLGWITGSGALATSLAKLSGPMAFASLAGGAADCLENLGLTRSIALETARALRNGNAVLAVECPTGKLGEFEVMEILDKYQAQRFVGLSGITRKVIFAL